MVRAGHKATIGRIIADVKTSLDARQRSIPKLEQQRKKLREKYDIIRKLDGEIQGLLEAEDEVSNEIEQADIVSDEIELTLLLLDEALTEAEDPQATVTTRTEPAERNQSLVDGSPTRESNDRAHASPTSSPVPDRIRTTNKVKLPRLCLRKFEGDLTSWATFWDSYQSSIHLNPDLSSVDKFNYLHSLVDGIAAEA